jgi:hypothetical protein
MLRLKYYPRRLTYEELVIVTSWTQLSMEEPFIGQHIRCRIVASWGPEVTQDGIYHKNGLIWCGPKLGHLIADPKLLYWINYD